MLTTLEKTKKKIRKIELILSLENYSFLKLKWVATFIEFSFVFENCLHNGEIRI
jgi:hypothetical protein